MPPDSEGFRHHDVVARPRIRAAYDGDVDEILDLLSEAAHWVTTLGIAQWPEWFPREFIAEQVANNEVFVAVDGDVIAATVCVQWTDPMFWPDAAHDAVYIHRLAVRRSHAGAGLGEQIIRWAENEALAAGRAWIRLDCLTENTRLRRYYERLGFEHLDDIEGENPPPFDTTFRPRWRSSRYQKRCRRTPPLPAE